MPGCNQDLSFGYIGVPFLKGDQQNSNHAIQVTLPALPTIFLFQTKVYLLRDLLATASSHKNKNKKTKIASLRVRPFILWLAFILRWSSAREEVFLNSNASTLNFFSPGSAKRRFALACLFSLDPLDPLVHGRTSACEQPVCSRATTIVRKIVVRTPITKQRRYSVPNCWTNSPKNHRACKVGLCQL